jgi:hypothetical protein
VTPNSVQRLAARLHVGLDSPGVCTACLSFVAFALDEDDERRVAGEITHIAPVLWDEGLGDVVRLALERAAAKDGEAGVALGHLEAERERSGIFRAVVRRLAVEAREEVRRVHLASLN